MMKIYDVNKRNNNQKYIKLFGVRKTGKKSTDFPP